MSYQVIARKWRPKNFDELVGQNHVGQTLLNALRSGRLPQALLFTGPRGTGKTSTARIFAKSLRCPDSKDHIPCNACSECTEIATGRSFDVLEIDGASNNGVDAIRELRETVGHMPSSGKYKVFIIDEVHMLSTSAFNALLKTLEEPPAHVVFILATTEAQKIPNTVLSRCQRFDFRTIATQLIAQRLAAICAADGVPAESEALWLLAQQSGGSMRDSQSLLEQVITYGNGSVLRSEVIETLGLTSHELLASALDAICRKDLTQTLAVLQSLQEAGVEPKVFCQDLLRDLRNLLMVKLQPHSSSGAFWDMAPSEVERLKSLSDGLSPEDIHLLFEMALKGAQDLQRSMNPHLVLEMLLLKMAQAPQILHLEKFLKEQWAPESEKSPISQPKARGVSLQESSSTTPQKPAVEIQALAPAPSVASRPEPAKKSTPAGLSANPWFGFVQQVKGANGFLGALLENTAVKAETDTELILEVPPKLEFLLDQLQDKDNRQRVESFINTFWGKNLSLKIELQEVGSHVRPTPKEALQNKKDNEKINVERAADQHPLIKDLKRKLNAQIVSIKENT